MHRTLVLVTALAVSVATPSLAENRPAPEEYQTKPTERLLQFAQSWSCTPRRTCSRTIRSCAEARWALENCSWGPRLDRDRDGIPCENLC